VPSGEACNAEDDDCNGTADDGLGSITCGLGACTTTVTACANGVGGTCMAPAGAVNDITCNSIDDDCDGAIDENCANCVKVAPSGNDANAASTNNTVAFLTIPAALAWASADNTRPHIVCVANGATCAAAPANYAGPLTMVNGYSVYGGYESTLFTQCGVNAVSVLLPGVGEGVVFPATVTTPTVLDGFRIDRGQFQQTAGVTVNGGTNVILSNLIITSTVAVVDSYGVNVINAGNAVITRSTILGGTGAGSSIGVRVFGARARIVDNCLSLDANGRCDDGCGGTNRSIRGRTTVGTGEAYAVLFDNAAGSEVAQSALCGNDADQGAALRIRGNATGIVVRSSNLFGWGGAMDAHGVWAEDCGDAAPRITDNFFIAGAGDTGQTRVDGVRAVGACHPVVDGNVRITGGGEGQASAANGVYCGRNASGASRCVVLGNTLIEGSQFGFPPSAVGVRCDDGACNRIAGNTITGRGGVDSWGIRMMRTGAVVERNNVAGGCSSMSATGIYAEDAWSRIENNFVRGGSCVGAATVVRVSRAMHAVAGPLPGELDVHSNSLAGLGAQATCQSSALFVETTGGTASPDGVFRNNVLDAGVCMARYGVVEATAAADPRVFQNNDLSPVRTPTALYFDENSTAVGTDVAVNALTDMTSSGNLSVDPLFASYPADLHLMSGSACLGAGTATGVPAVDFDGDARPATTPDIGADERP